MDKETIQREALHNAVTGQALTNYPAIFAGFMAKGIPEDQIRPRENVFSYNAWRALKRQVRKGEHGVKILTFVPCEKTDKQTGQKEEYRRPWSVTVFHVSQTDELVERNLGNPQQTCEHSATVLP